MKRLLTASAFPYLYTRPIGALGPGGSYGNPDCFARFSRESDLVGLWCTDNHFYCGRLSVDVCRGGEKALPSATTFGAGYQSTRYHLGALTIEKLSFIPYRTGYQRSACTVLKFTNDAWDGADADVDVEVTIRFPAVTVDGFPIRPPHEQMEKSFQAELAGDVLVVWTSEEPIGAGHLDGNPLETRVVGIPGMSPANWAFHVTGLARLNYRVRIPAGVSLNLPVILAVSGEGKEAALAGYRAASDWEPVLAASEANLAGVTGRSDIFTPDPLVNRGIAWAKVNCLRVQHRYPAGWGFTNDPPQDVIVVRDVAWYVLGADYLTPGFCGEMLEMVARHGTYPGGKLAEYFTASGNPPRIEDNGLNVNDDTPLFVLAVYHHYRATGDAGFLRRFFPRVEAAVAWIVDQMKDGLVFTQAAGTNVWGISGWRNIIHGYNLSGHVTELNAECYGALLAAAAMARACGRADLGRRYADAAATLRAAMHGRLRSGETGLYHLMVRRDGRPVDEATGDLVFPVLFSVAEAETAARIAGELLGDRFWTPYGCRTVGRGEPGYDPDHAWQLLGGIWPNLTAWVAHAFRDSRPGLVAATLHNLFRLPDAEEPRAWGNVCPGEFPERLHGENFTSRGMPLSPWMPPTYLWLAVEGLAGLDLPAGAAGDLPGLDPRLPDDWRWLAGRRIPVTGGDLSFFYYRGALHTNMPVRSDRPLRVYQADVTERVALDVVEGTPERVFHLALADADEMVVFCAAEGPCVVRLRPGTGLPGAGRDFTCDLRAGSGAASLLPVRAGAGDAPAEEAS